jgi:flagellar biosynthetic protein FlhB
MTAGYALRFAMLSAPILIGTAAVGIVANVLQVGFKVTPKVLKPDMNKLNPISGMSRLVSKRSFVELAKSIAKILIVAYCAYSFLRTEYPVFIDLGGMAVSDMMSTVTGLCWRLMGRGCIAMLVIGILDYIYQKFEFENSIKMTKQEVKEEYKRTEGDPQVKGKIRGRQRQIARQRMSQEVARADVVITNPTHFAVAIKYDSKEMSAPIVVAKGQRLLALRIREIAKENGVPIMENPPVARLLYRTVEIGQQIPEALYQTVAEILAYVYQLGKRAGKKPAA